MRKIFITTTMLASFALAGCTATGENTNTSTAIGTANDIGMNVLKAAIDNQCRSQLTKLPAWRIASVAMTEGQEEAVQSKVCGCVSEQAPKQVTITELGNAAMDAEYRGKLVTKVVAKSLQTCYANFTK